MSDELVELAEHRRDHLAWPVPNLLLFDRH
jgi:hypothetical protein